MSKCHTHSDFKVCEDFHPINALLPIPQYCRNCHQLGHEKRIWDTQGDRMYTIPNRFMRWLWRRWIRVGRFLFDRYEPAAQAHANRMQYLPKEPTT